MTPKRHSAFLRPEFSASLGNNGSENQNSTIVRSETATTFEVRGEGKDSATETGRPIQTATVHNMRSGLIGSTLSDSFGRHPSKPPLIPLSVHTASKKQRQRANRASPTHIDI